MEQNRKYLTRSNCIHNILIKKWMVCKLLLILKSDLESKMDNLKTDFESKREKKLYLCRSKKY